MEKEIKKTKKIKRKRQPSKYQEVFKTDFSFEEIIALAASGVGMWKDEKKRKK